MRTARTKSDSFIPAEPEGASPISSHNGANRLAKQVVWVLRVLIKYLRDDPDEGNCWTEGVAQRGIAATRIPSKEAIGCKPQSRDAALSLHKLERGGRDLHNIRTTLGIKQVGTTELMRERLAIIAVADHAIRCPRRWVRDRPPDFSAATA